MTPVILGLVAAGFAWSPQTLPDGVPVAWDRDEIRWWFGEAGAGSADRVAELRAGFEPWGSVAAAGPRLDEAGTIDGAVIALDGRNEVGFVAEWPYEPTTLAVTQIWVNSSASIVEFDLLVQADPPLGWSVDGGGVDLRSVVLHEVGHALGLGHSDVPLAAMYGSVRPGEQRALHDDDQEGLLALYGAPDTGGSFRRASPGGCSHTSTPWGWLAVVLVLARRVSGRPGPARSRCVGAGFQLGCQTCSSLLLGIRRQYRSVSKRVFDRAFIG